MNDTALDQQLTEAAVFAFTKAFGGIIHIALTDGPTLYIDGFEKPPSLRRKQPDASAPTVIWRASTDTMRRILEGERALVSAYLSGRLSITGDMAVMGRLSMENAP